MFTTLAKTSGIGSVRYDASKAWQEGETPMGVQDWLPAFSNYDALGEGQKINNIERLGDGSFRVWRNLAGGGDDMVQSRTFNVNPDGSVAWKGSWNTKQQESNMDQFRNAAMLAAAGVGGMGLAGLGPAAGLFGTGGAAAGGAATGAGSAATNAALIDSALGTAGYGASSAGLGGAAAGAAAAADPISAYLTTGATEGSTIGNALAGAGGASGAVGAGTTAGTLGGASSALGGLGNLLPSGTSGWLNLGGNLLNSYLGNKAAGDASAAQIAAAREANQLSKYMYDTTRKDNLPALQARNSGLSGYQNLLKNPGQIVNDPGYKFGFDQGVAGYDNSGAARGMRLSGAQAKALTRFGQDYGQTKFDQSLNRYGNLAGLGQTGAGTIANAGQNYANTAGQNITGAGNAAAAGYIGSANAISGGITNYLRSQQENQFLRQLGLGG